MNEELNPTTVMIMNVYKNSFGFAILLSIIFTILKVTNSINLHWAWVLSPLWIRVLVGMIGFTICLISELIAGVNKK